MFIHAKQKSNNMYPWLQAIVCPCTVLM